MSTAEEKFDAFEREREAKRRNHMRLVAAGVEPLRHCVHCGSDAQDADPVHASDCHLVLRAQRLSALDPCQRCGQRHTPEAYCSARGAQA